MPPLLSLEPLIKDISNTCVGPVQMEAGGGGEEAPVQFIRLIYYHCMQLPPNRNTSPHRGTNVSHEYGVIEHRSPIG